jgi:hypothetical protein
LALRQLAYSFLIFFALKACTPQQSTAPIDQLPNPELGQKPQFLFLFDSRWRFWNLPHPEELESKTRVRATVSELASSEAIESELREFNARTADLLLMAAPEHTELIQSLGVFTHPARALSATLSREQSTQSIRWELGSAFTLVAEFCQQAELNCSYPGELLTKFENWGFEPQIPNLNADRLAPALLVNFTTPFGGDSSAESLLSLSVNWITWSEQVLRDLRQKPQLAASNSPWREISLARGNLNINLSISNSDPLSARQAELNELLQKLRLKHLN